VEHLTIDQDEIRHWAEERGGKPAVIDHPGARADKVGIRIDFPGETDDTIKSITRPATWDEFFRIFDNDDLLLAFDDEVAGGDPADWYHFEKRGQLEGSESEADDPDEDILPDGERGPLGYEQEAGEPEGDWPEGSEPKPGSHQT
jgi:hypothetical protein